MHTTTGTYSSQYGEASHVPLIKSPSLRVPQLVQMPPDIHPLPDSVSAYFVYPFSIEPHVIALETARQTTLQAHNARRQAYLKAREDEKEQRRRDALRKVAPGFEPSGGTLVPKQVGIPAKQVTQVTASSLLPPPPPALHQRDVMSDLVDQLAALDAASSQSK